MHGAVRVTGIIGAPGGAPVTIAPLPGHTPVLSTLTFVTAARWLVRDIVVAPRFADPISWSASGTAKAAAIVDVESGESGESAIVDVESGEADARGGGGAAGAADEAVDRGGAAAASTATVKARGITISSQALEDCSDITLLRVTQTCGQTSDWWTPAQWIRARHAGGIHIFGRNITVDTCHLHNAAGVYINYHAHKATVTNTIIENFSSDAMNIKASGATVEKCIHHCGRPQSGRQPQRHVPSLGLVGCCVPGQPLGCVPRLARAVDGSGRAGPGRVRHGWKRRWRVTDCLVATDHPIGIWIQGDDSCTVTNNTVVRCGASLFFSSAPTSILVGPHKSGAVIGGSKVANNLAEAYRLSGSKAVTKANQTIKPAHLRTAFVRWPVDVHLTQEAAVARGMGAASAVAFVPSYDADGVLRPTTGTVDAGCLQYRAEYTAPRSGPVLPATSVTVVPGLGFGVSWTPNGYRSSSLLVGTTQVALCRTGASSYFVFVPGAGAPGTRPPSFFVQGVPDL